MRKFVLALFMVAVVALLLPGAAFADIIIDPNVGFCAPPATAASCSGTDPSGHTNPISGTSFGMWSFGSSDSASPWFLLVAVPEAPTAVAPTITSPDFTLTLINHATFKPTTGGSIDDLFSLTADGSLNSSNLFGPVEQAAYGGTPSDFVVYEFSVTGAFSGGTAYSFNDTGLQPGTIIGAESLNGNKQFSTPFTTAGLDHTSNQPPPTPEPASLALFGTGLVGIAGVVRRKMKK